MDMSPSLSMASDYMSTFVTSRLVIANPKTSHQEGGKSNNYIGVNSCVNCLVDCYFAFEIVINFKERRVEYILTV